MSRSGAVHGILPGSASVASIFALLGLLAAASGAIAQEASVAVVPDSARVGDVVHVAVRVVLPPGERAVWPDTLSLPTDAEAENAARVRERIDTLADGTIQVTAVYALTPWRPGKRDLGTVEFQVLGGEETPETRTAQLPSLNVISVLPADTAGIEPRPARGVLGRSWSWWPILLVALGVLLAALLLAWWIRRKRRRALVPDAIAAPTARERALAALDAARADGLLARGEVKAFYIRVAGAVRHFVAALEPEWGEDLTTTELLARVRAIADREDGRALETILRAADQVKFARRRPDPATAEAEWSAARAWVAAFRAAPPAPPGEVAA